MAIENFEKHLQEYTSLGFICTPLVGKVPILKKWNQFSHVPDYRVFKNHNIGILTGKSSGITILDIDYKEDGMKIWKAISSLYPKINTPIVITPNKGLHIYFKYNKKLESTTRLKLNGKRIGWDILNDGRQAVAPPSSDISNNKKYRWVLRPTRDNIDHMPKWIEDYIMLLHSDNKNHISSI